MGGNEALFAGCTKLPPSFSFSFLSPFTVILPEESGVGK